MNFIHIDSVGGDCKEWIPFTHRAQDGFNYICVLTLTLPSTSLDQVYQIGHKCEIPGLGRTPAAVFGSSTDVAVIP